MGRSERRKGIDAEREVVNIARVYMLDARRSILSRSPDVIIAGRTVSVKRRRRGMEWVYTELKKHDYILFRADNRPWLKIQIWPLVRKKGFEEVTDGTQKSDRQNGSNKSTVTEVE
jgi:hypothetical protein